MKFTAGTRFRLAVAVVVAGLAGGCADEFPYGRAATARPAVRDVEIVLTSHQATERLLRDSQQPLDKGKPILVASLVNVANLQQSSNLGRIIAEQISSRLTQLGYDTREMKLRGTFLIKEGQGEFILSRALRDISQKQQAQAVIAGVYAVAKNAVYVTVRLIRAEDSLVIASYDYRLPLGPDTAALLGPFDTVEY